jgi:hypothetical protein
MTLDFRVFVILICKQEMNSAKSYSVNPVLTFHRDDAFSRLPSFAISLSPFLLASYTVAYTVVSLELSSEPAAYPSSGHESVIF